MNTLRALAAGLVTGLMFGNAWAGWTLDNDASALYFASTKKDTISEVHRIKQLNGHISDDGKATLNIDLASVDTQIQVRDERMQRYLFEVEDYPFATVTLDLGEQGVQPGLREITAKLSLHGVEKEVPAQVMVLDNSDTLQVVSVAPVMLSADDFGMKEGVDTLREIAQLPSISLTVPTTFFLQFEKEE